MTITNLHCNCWTLCKHFWRDSCDIHFSGSCVLLS